LGLLSGAAAATFGAVRSGRARTISQASPSIHPEPREGIDASHVLPADQLINPTAAPEYDMVREIPQVMDGIGCHCGCAELEGYYSLLTCYEEQGMAQFCDICKGQAREAYTLHGRGKSLDAIRTAIDTRFG
jgi:hypothetical protein